MGRVIRPFALLATLALIAGCASTPETHRSPAQSATTSMPSTSEPLASLPTTSSVLDLTDRSRGVVSGGETIAAERHLPTTVTRPVAPGHRPLVVLLGGYGVGPATYQRLADHLASRGYLVAAPSLPQADPAQGIALDRTHLDDEAKDASFVIDSLLAGKLAKHINPSKVTVVGHSDGADVALLLGYDPQVNDPAVRSVVALAPDPISGSVITGGPDLLLIHGSADEIVDPASAARVAEVVSAPRWSVTLIGADHASAVVGPSPWTASSDQAVGLFLTATLGGETEHLADELRALPGVTVEAAGLP